MNTISCVLFILMLTSPILAQSGNEKFKSSVKPIVQVFGAASYNIEDEKYEYSFSRAHLGFQYQFNKDWQARIIIDRGRATSVEEISVTDAEGNPLTVQNTSNEGAYYTMYLKFASLRWQVTDNLSLEGGAILQNHYITQEHFWGLRYVAQTFQDLYWAIPSSDLGFVVRYNLNKTLLLDAAITNGEGPRVKQDTLGRVKFAGGITIYPSGNTQIRFYYHHRQAGSDSLKTEQMFSLFTGYQLERNIRIGGEFNYMNHLNNVNNTTSYGFSLYSVGQLMKRTELFIRYDQLYYDLNAANSKNEVLGNGQTFIGGISYSPAKGINLSLNYQGWLSDNESSDNKNNLFINMEYQF